MSELRWIILGIGILAIAVIYLWESWKQKRELRSRVDNLPGTTGDSYANIHISPKKEKHREKHIDLSAAAAAFNTYLKKSRDKDGPESTIEPAVAADDSGTDDMAAETDNTTSDINGEKEAIIVIYIVASSGTRFAGRDIQKAFQSVDLEFGDMQIFHYRGHGDESRQRALFSVANIHEPGTFDSDTMANMTTEGLAMFMRLPAPIGGDIAFEIMLDCAESLANQLGGELRNEKHVVLDNDSINHLRQIAGKY